MCFPGNVRLEPTHAWIFPSLFCVKPQKRVSDTLPSKYQLRNSECSLNLSSCFPALMLFFPATAQIELKLLGWLHTDCVHDLIVAACHKKIILWSPNSSWVTVTLECLKLNCKASEFWKILQAAESLSWQQITAALSECVCKPGENFVGLIFCLSQRNLWLSLSTSNTLKASFLLENTEADVEAAPGQNEEKSLPAAPVPSPVAPAPAPSRRNPPGGKSSLVLG